MVRYTQENSVLHIVRVSFHDCLGTYGHVFLSVRTPSGMRLSSDMIGKRVKLHPMKITAD